VLDFLSVFPAWLQPQLRPLEPGTMAKARQPDTCLAAEPQLWPSKTLLKSTAKLMLTQLLLDEIL